jgi:hypothetical protein
MLDLLCQIVNQVVSAKEKFLKEIKSVILVSIQIIFLRTDIAGMEKILVVCIDQICHNVSLNQRGPNFNL